MSLPGPRLRLEQHKCWASDPIEYIIRMLYTPGTIQHSRYKDKYASIIQSGPQPDPDHTAPPIGCSALHLLLVRLLPPRINILRVLLVTQVLELAIRVSLALRQLRRLRRSRCWVVRYDH